MDSFLFFVCLISISITDNYPPPPPAFGLKTPVVKTAKVRWSEYGKLVATKFRLENGQPIYALIAQDNRLTYVATKAGKSLARYEGRTVAVFGPVVDAPSEPVRYVRATHVAVP
jgi:hypothetical protein